MEARFFSRALVACNGALVWPDKVLRAIGQDPVQACEDLPDCTNVTATHLDGIRIPTGSEVDPWITADALITPDRTRELRAGCFEKFAEDVVYRHMLAIATIEWIETGSDFTNEIPLLRNASKMAQLLGMDPASNSVLQFMFLVTHLEPLQATLCTIPCVSMGAAISMLTRWVGAGERASIEALFSARGVLVPLGLHKGVETSTVDLFDAMMLRDAQLFARFTDESRSHGWDASRLLPEASSTTITLEEVPHLQAVHQLNSALLANSAARKLEGTHFLFHGVSGSGKTSYARLLAQDANLGLYEIAPTSTVNGNIRPYNRVELLMVAIRVLEAQAGSVILFDDAEDFFGSIFNGDSDTPDGAGRAWLHQLLETSTVPILWIAQSIKNVPSSALRRFTRIQEITVPPQTVRLRQVRRHLLSIGLDQTSESLETDLTALAPGALVRVIRNVEIAEPCDEKQATLWLEHEVSALRRIPDARILDSTETKLHFKPEYLNIRNGPPLDNIVQRLQSHGPSSFRVEFDSENPS